MSKSKLLKMVALLETATMLSVFAVSGVMAAEKNLTPWGFFSGKTFNYDSVAEYFNVETDFSYNSYPRTDLGGSAEGISYSIGKSGTDANWQNWINTFPSNSDNRFYVQPPQGKVQREQIGAMFTVPEQGLWRVECDALNYGSEGNYGGGNAVRICVLEPNEVVETANNCVDIDIRNANAEGGGYYKSDITPLLSGSKIMMRASAGKDRWGDAFYISYKIHKVNVSGEILATYDLNQIGVKTCQVFDPSAERLSVETAVGKSAEWTNTPKFGPWDFYIGTQFYKRATYKDKTSYIYYAEKENPYDAKEPYLTKTRAKYAGVLAEPIRWSGKQTKYNRSGITIASNTGASGDYNWRAAIEFYPGSVDKTVRFTPGPNGKDVLDGMGVVVRFNVPATGEYCIHTDLKNYGWMNNNLVGYGTENLARISILKGNEDVQTEANSTVFEIPIKTTIGDSYNSGKVNLTAGDRVYFEVYNGAWGNLDDFIGSYAIDRYTTEGTIAQSYNLGDASFTKTGKWNMFYAKQGENDILRYNPLMVASGSDLATSVGYYNYAGIVSTYWGATTGKVTMKNAAPSVGWNNSDPGVVCRTLENDMLISYDVTKTGIYNLSTTAKILTGSNANLKISKIASISNPDTIVDETVLAEVAVGNAEVKKEVMTALSAGDRVYFRISKSDATTETAIRINPSIQEKNAVTSVVAGGIPVTNIKTLLAGSKIDVTKSVALSDKNTKMILALYEKQGEKTALKQVTVADGVGDVMQTFSSSVTMPNDIVPANAFMKIMLLNTANMVSQGMPETY